MVNRLRALPRAAAASVCAGLLLTACGSNDNAGPATATSPGVGSGAIDCGQAKGQVLASGSSAQANAMSLWTNAFMAACPGADVNYKASSSGEGVTAFTQGTVAFAGTDTPLQPAEVAASKQACPGGKGIDLPMVGGPVAMGYNLPGVDKLVLDAPTAAEIFTGKITKWNDPAIVRLNPGTDLPAQTIQSFHRSDDSGTTQNLGLYLGKAAPAQWPYPPAKPWPAPGGQAAAGSSGVAAQVKQVAGAIGYFELSYATSQGIPTVRLDTGAGTPVEASPASASKAIAQAKPAGTGGDLALALDYTTKAEGAYPLVLVTYEIVCDTGNAKSTLPSVKAFLAYTASPGGQDILTKAAYAPIPEAVITKVRAAIASLS
ncbi:phosphate ABC transporter substrate-binding protein PstS [Streptomyces sp. NPDC004667]|uniref:phosphate ABC transporter substrate-binding protein PstS n=1 Tax=Streptomyces sp. NPDC004667 TaxID=3154285 RepID=UPI0033A5E8D1